MARTRIGTSSGGVSFASFAKETLPGGKKARLRGPCWRRCCRFTDARPGSPQAEAQWGQLVAPPLR
jgi:hypothetical protein